MDRFHSAARAALLWLELMLAFGAALALSDCGVAYQIGTRIKASRMASELKAGTTSLEVHRQWGEPELRQYLAGNTEVWSYPYKPNSNDLTAALFYSSAKQGDTGTFLDLKFIGGRLASWSEADHTIPAKERSNLGFGIGGGPIGSGTAVQPGAVHY